MKVITINGQRVEITYSSDDGGYYGVVIDDMGRDVYETGVYSTEDAVIGDVLGAV